MQIVKLLQTLLIKTEDYQFKLVNPRFLSIESAEDFCTLQVNSLFSYVSFIDGNEHNVDTLTR